MRWAIGCRARRLMRQPLFQPEPVRLRLQEQGATSLERRWWLTLVHHEP